MPSVVEVYKNAPLSICLTTEPMEGSANVTTAVRSGCADAIIKALLPMTHVSACESRSKYDSRLSSGANAKDEMLSLIIDTLRCGQGRSSPLFFELRRVLFLSGVTVGVSSFVGGVVLPACSGGHSRIFVYNIGLQRHCRSSLYLRYSYHLVGQI